MSGPGAVPYGIITALLTPLDERGQLDEDGLDRLLRRVLDGGVDGVSPAGSSGEGPRLTRAQRLRLAKLVCARADGRVPVYPAVPLTSVAEGLDELAALAETGARAALVAPPAYYPLPDADVLRLYGTLADASPLPLLLYNIPVFTRVSLAPEVVGELAAHPRVAGIKDSSRDLEYLQRLVRATGDAADFAVLTGTDTLLVASLDAGARGAIATSSNLVPRLSVALHRAYGRGERGTAFERQRELAEVVSHCRAGYFPAGWKAALAHAGVCGPYPAPPASPLPPEERARLERGLDSGGAGRWA